MTWGEGRLSSVRSVPARLLLIAGVCAFGASCSGDDTSPASDGASPTVESSDPTPRDSSRAANTKQRPGPYQGVTRPESPRDAAVQLRRARNVFDDKNARLAALRKAGAHQYVAYRAIGEEPGWDRWVLRKTPRQLRGIVRTNIDVRREFRSMFPDKLSDTLPAWKIVPPEPAAELKRFYREAERRFGVDWEYLAAINLVETGMGRIQGTSVAGARGPMQFIGPTWEQYGRGDITDPRDAIMAAGRYLQARGFTKRGGINGALYSYNNDTRYVRGVRGIASVIKAQPDRYRAYHAWPIVYLSNRGDVLLTEGYSRKKPIKVRRYLEAQPRPNIR